MIDLKAKLEEWHETRSVAVANEICEELWEELEAFDEPKLA